MASKTPLQIAQELDDLGLNVFPARFRGKATIVKWQQFQDARTTGRLAQWFSGNTQRNFWIMTGHTSGVVVLDCDDDTAERYWREDMGLADVMDRTACVKTVKGHHYYFLVEPNDRVASWSQHPTTEEPDLPSFDVRAENTGVIAPPSVHETGVVYEWVRPLQAALPLPDALRGRRGSGSGPAAASRAAGAGTGGGTRSMLSKLLEKPGSGGWNNWLVRVAGHYAKQFHNARDAYDVHCRMAFRMLQDGAADPMSEKDFLKTIESAWKMEHENNPQRDASETTGWLVAGDHCLMTQVVKAGKKDDEPTFELGEYADFDLRATGVVEDDESLRVYDVEILRKRQRDSRQAILPASVLADSRKLNAWLAEFGVTVIPPETMWPRVGSVPARITRYLESQDPPRFAVVDCLGWDGAGGGFVAHEGVIRADGMHGFQGLRPHPKLRGWAPYRYGMADEQIAQETLREILTFHDETVCSVFGAWWAACLLKPQIHEVASQFPFMALEAPSESGKTTGFFALMLELNGNTQGQVSPTKAALRDAISGHQSGIVWLDDLDDPTFLYELLRQATGEGSVSKKGEDRTSQAVVRLVAPICVSGEALGLGDQKALLDRAVAVKVPSPVGRRSLKDANRPQWDDIVALRQRFPAHEGGLTQVAGTLVSLALRHQDELLGGIRELRPRDAGRWGDKIAIVRAGARLLDAMAGTGTEHSDRVDAWAATQVDTGSENTLTMKLIPRALAAWNWPSRPEPSEGPRGVATPVFVEKKPGGDSVLWFNAAFLATWWYQFNGGRVSLRTETEEALIQQARALKLGGAMGIGRKQWRLGQGRDASGKAVYWRIDGSLAESILDRAAGNGGVSTMGELVVDTGVGTGVDTPLTLPQINGLGLSMSPNPDLLD